VFVTKNVQEVTFFKAQLKKSPINEMQELLDNNSLLIRRKHQSFSNNQKTNSLPWQPKTEVDAPTENTTGKVVARQQEEPTQPSSVGCCSRFSQAFKAEIATSQMQVIEMEATHQKNIQQFKVWIGPNEGCGPFEDLDR
jgi:hypothetical protein